MPSLAVYVLVAVFQNFFSVGAGLTTARRSLNQIKPTRTASIQTSRTLLAQKRATTQAVLTCGYANGDPNQPRTAEPGYGCRVDTVNALWGFCPTSVIVASDCGLAAACVDGHSCSTGCGNPSQQGLTTFTCKPNPTGGAGFCSTVLSHAGVDQTYSYIACGDKATINVLEAIPTVRTTSTTTSSNTLSSSATTSEISSTSIRQSLTSPASSVVSASAMSSPSTSGIDGTSSNQSQTSTSSSGVSESAGSSSTNSSRSGNTPTGAIVGGVCGGIGLICITLIIIYILRRQREVERERNQRINDNNMAQMYQQSHHQSNQLSASTILSGRRPYSVADSWKERWGRPKSTRQVAPAELSAYPAHT